MQPSTFQPVQPVGNDLVATPAGRLPAHVAARCGYVCEGHSARPKRPESGSQNCDGARCSRPHPEPQLGSFAANVLPPLFVVADPRLVIWQIAASASDNPKASPPSPSRIWAEANDLILRSVLRQRSSGYRAWDGVFSPVAGARGNRVLDLAAVVGTLLGAVSWVKASLGNMRGLDPIFQVLRTVPPLAWLPICTCRVPRQPVHRRFL